MKALVIYESMYGNTRDIAEAIAAGLASAMEVETCEVGHAPQSVPADTGLLVVGAPTHQFGMSRASSREQAAHRESRTVISSRIGVREWLDRLPVSPGGVQTASFSTVLDRPRFLRYFGSAGSRIDKRLSRLGYQSVVPSEVFWVAGSTGPLLAGELDRARRWGAELASQISVEAAQPA